MMLIAKMGLNFAQFLVGLPEELSQKSKLVH